MFDLDSEAVWRGWRLERSISLGHIFTAASIALSIAAPLVIWGSTVESRLSVLQTVQALRQERTAEDPKERLDRDPSHNAASTMPAAISPLFRSRDATVCL